MNKLTAAPTTVTPTHKAERLLEALAASLEIPQSKYEAAERSYKSVGKWLDRDDSVFASKNVTVYPQGSFRLGTVIPPHDADGHYDLDVVCEIDMGKLELTQKQLKERLGGEVKAYAKAHGMEEPIEARRCWTLNYADGAQFHMDILPALPDGLRQRLLVEAAGMQAKSLDKALAITCWYDQNYNRKTDDWPGSNPKGYSDWFRERMKVVFNARRETLRLYEARASVEDIPEYRVTTPMQSAIKILKRHRDMRFTGEEDLRPISIILTTLGALAYNQETTISGALFGILSRMESYIEVRNGVYWIENPADPRENFADKWDETPAKKDAFYDWLQTAKEDFALAAGTSADEDFIDVLAPRMGRPLVEAAVRTVRPTSGHSVAASLTKVSDRIRGFRDAPHRKPMTFPSLSGVNGKVSLTLTVNRAGYRPDTRTDDGLPVSSGSSLTFDAHTTIPKPFKVFWQVVNTGDAARQARDLRGGFDEGTVQSGGISRHETARYRGSHSIECFIVKDGYCVAKSGPFIVNIK
ncbi:nucleotidyltransferase [Burkholderia sp. SR8]|uniref:nucleotide-binding domain-containing protein n=1 Tax=Burkholderia sp. SR8 TaxID=3062277 RepID=UPI0040641139